MSAHASSDNVTLRNRVHRLQAELIDEEVPASKTEAFPSRLQADWPRALDILCEELVHARYVAVHEGYRPSYGCFIVPDLTTITAQSGISLAPVDNGNHDGETAAGRPGSIEPTASNSSGTRADVPSAGDADLRLIVDGEHTFLVRDLQNRTGFGTVGSASDDLSLLELCRNLMAVCVQRQRDGRIQLLMEGIVCINDGYDWRWLVTARQMLPGVLASLDPPADLVQELSNHLGEIMDLCAHILSPRGIGATLVWQIGSHGPVGTVSNQPSRLPAALNLFHKEDRFAIVSLLASVDGACFVARDGDVLNYWAMLDPSAEAKQLVAEQGGTRHTSAKRYSFDEPRSVVFVVSADGPVTIFSDGAMLARLAETAQDLGRTWLTRLPLAEGARVRSDNEELDCTNCGKRIRIEIDTHPTATESAEAGCPVCRANNLRSYQHVIRLRVRTSKSWDPQSGEL